jgi:hypothetical protein
MTVVCKNCGGLFQRADEQLTEKDPYCQRCAAEEREAAYNDALDREYEACSSRPDGTG